LEGDVVARERLQLLGITALLVACKACREPNVPDAGYLAYLTANAYTAPEVRPTETRPLDPSLIFEKQLRRHAHTTHRHTCT
jgi:hypothetical protein